jgi:hypothetical protein
MPALIGLPFTGQVSLMGFPWKAHANPAPRRTAMATLKIFIRAPFNPVEPTTSARPDILR